MLPCSQIRRQHLVSSSADHLGRAGGDDLAEIEHVHLVAHAHDQAHVVLDQHDRRPVVGQRAQQGRESLGLLGVLARRGLVEQQQARAARPAPGRPRPGGRCRWAARRRSCLGDRRCRPSRSMMLVDDRRRPSRRCGPSSAATSRLSRTLSRPNSSSRWNVRASPCRARRAGPCLVTSRPSITHPPRGRACAARRRRRTGCSCPRRSARSAR